MAVAMKYVLLYESADDVAVKAPIYGGAHRAHWQQYIADGTLLMIGPFTNPADGAMGVFKTRAAAEEFAEGDPFVLNGVAKSWRVMEWMEAIVPG